MQELRLSTLKKTWIFDLDGTLVIHNGYKEGQDVLLPGVKEFMSQIPEDDYIMILTSREKEAELKTTQFLKDNGIRYDHIQFEMPMGERLLFNDDKPSGLQMCYGIRHSRNVGLEDTSIVIDESL
ncbi:MAG: HAD family acid phosphatase [Lachnospiraceae bacterium]|nr:HAD family acid phosphatase [Lachnospiraceae bacterium]